MFKPDILIYTTRGRCIKRIKKTAENLRTPSGSRISDVSRNSHCNGRKVKVMCWAPTSAQTSVIGCDPWGRLHRFIHLFSLAIWTRAESLFLSSTGIWFVSYSKFGSFFPSAMLRVVVESASGIPKKKLGNPDPIAAIVFRGEKCGIFFFFYCPLRKMNVLNCCSITILRSI